MALFFAKAQQTDAGRNAHQASQVPSAAELKVSHTAKDSRRIDGGVGNTDLLHLIVPNQVHAILFFPQTLPRRTY